MRTKNEYRELRTAVVDYFDNESSGTERLTAYAIISKHMTSPATLVNQFIQADYDDTLDDARPELY